MNDSWYESMMLRMTGRNIYWVWGVGLGLEHATLPGRTKSRTLNISIPLPRLYETVGTIA